MQVDIPTGVREAIQSGYRQFLESKGFRARWGQRHMIATIARALWQDSRAPLAVIEAGTGTGKTLGYLLPTLATAQAKGVRLVVATATVALQEQLMYRDLPALKSACGLDFSYALVKGRGRYACNLKLERLAAGGVDDALPGFLSEGNQEQAADPGLYQQLQQALISGQWDGDLDHWPEAIPERSWRPLVTDRYQCLNRRCPMVTDCVFFRTREALEEVDCLITNQDLVMSDLALGGGVILPAPEETLYVFDEAHHLVDKARNHMSSFVRLSNLSQLLEDCVDMVQRMLREVGAESIAKLLHQLLAQAGPLPALQQELREALQQITADTEADSIRFAHGQVPAGLRDSSAKLALVWKPWLSTLGSIHSKLEQAADDTATRSWPAQDWLLVCGQLLGRGEAVLDALLAYQSEREADPRARWVEIDRRYGDFSLHAIPLRPGSMLKEQLWERVQGAVLTSATLTAMGSFELMMDNLGLPADSQCLRIDSPFDFAGRAELVVPPDCPEAHEVANHDRYLVDFLPGAVLNEGGTLVLFSSERQMRHVADALRAQQSVLPLLVQGELSKQEIIDRHRARIDGGEPSAIFGLASFAEGVDLPGDYCRHVVIVKIPFPVPDDPLIASLGEWMESQGRNAFGSIMLPEASLALIQAAGRLMRSELDGGRVTVLDRRLVTRHYGRRLMDSLPPFKRVLSG